jgi:hypothetical protein
MASKTSLKKALAASVEHAELVTSSMKNLDKDLLYAAVNEVKNLIEEDPTLEVLFADDLKTMRNNLRFISQASGIVKNAQNVSDAAEAMAANAERFMGSQN